MTDGDFGPLSDRAGVERRITNAGPLHRYRVRLVSMDWNVLSHGVTEPVLASHEVTVASRLGSAKAVVMATEWFYGVPRPTGTSNVGPTPVIFDVAVDDLGVVNGDERVVDDLLDESEE